MDFPNYLEFRVTHDAHPVKNIILRAHMGAIGFLNYFPIVLPKTNDQGQSRLTYEDLDFQVEQAKKDMPMDFKGQISEMDPQFDLELFALKRWSDPEGKKLALLRKMMCPQEISHQTPLEIYQYFMNCQNHLYHWSSKGLKIQQDPYEIDLQLV